MSEHLLLSKDGKRCWKAVVKGRKYTIYSGPASNPTLRGSNTLSSAAEALERVLALKAHMQTKGYAAPGTTPDPAPPKAVSLPSSVMGLRFAAAKRHIDKLQTPFKPSKGSSLATLCTLAVVLFAHRRVEPLKDLADFAAQLGPAVKPSHAHHVQSILAIAGQACLEEGDAATRQRLFNVLQAGSFNPRILTLDWVEHHHSFGLHDRGPMTVTQETKWRTTMVRVLATVIELGGSPTLPVARAQQELNEHLRHLRAVWKVQQAQPPARPRGRRGPHPIPSHLFPKDKVSR